VVSSKIAFGEASGDSAPTPHILLSHLTTNSGYGHSMVAAEP